MRKILVACLLMAGIAHAAPSTAKPWTYWWWLGSAANEADITWQLEKFAEAGLGGVHLIPIYGVKGFDAQEVPHLSPRWVELFTHTVNEAERLGVGVDMTLGTGWPYGGPHVDDAISALKVDFVRQKVRAGKSPRALKKTEGLIALRAFGEDGAVVDLLPKLQEDGAMDWVAETGAHDLVAVYQAPTGQQVKRAAPGAEGHVLDHYSGKALKAHLARFEEPLGDGLNALRGVYNDSFEVYGANWTPDLFDIFAGRRGYDLRDHLPAFLGDGDADEVRRVRHDYRQTVAECLLDDFTKPWSDWADKRGLATRLQAHGSPGNLLDLYAASSIPETEHFGPEGVDTLFWKFASSAAHTTGKPLVSSESCTWLDEHFNVTLAQVKDAIDHLWLAGINHVFFHGTPYSPPDAPWPGWQFYASTWFGPANPIYRDFPALNEYITKVQKALQEGVPGNDILLYFPMSDYWMTDIGVRDMLQPLTAHNSEEWLKGRPVGMTARMLQDRGYTFDYVSDAQLAETRFEDGKIRLGHGRYVTVIVPACEYMPVETMTQLHRIAVAGANVIFQSEGPRDVPGWHDVASRRQSLQEFTSLLEDAREADKDIQVAVGEGQWIRGGELEALLAIVGAIREPMVDDGLHFIRLRSASGPKYFVKNVNAHAYKGPISVALGEEGNTYAMIPEGMLAPGETLFFEAYIQPTWAFAMSTYSRMVPAGAPQEVDGPWQLSFIAGGPELPASVELESARPWTELGVEEMEQFAGTARYSRVIDRPINDFKLEVADLADSARLLVNGNDMGTRIAPPYTWYVNSWNVHKGSFIRRVEIAIEVTNVGANRIRWMDQQGMEWRIFKDINFVNIDYKPFDASAWPVRPAGILGPVTITPYEETTIL